MISTRALCLTAVYALFALVILVACGGSGGAGTSAGGSGSAPKSFGTAQLIETDNASHAELPQIAFDGSGSALAVWRQSDGTRYNIWSNRYNAGTGWGTAQLLETDNSGDALDPQIAMNAGGNAVVVWTHSDGTNINIMANRYTAGVGWGTAQLIETDNSGDAASPVIAIDASGNAMAAWYQSDGTRNNIWANRYTLGAGWGTAALIETDSAGDALFPRIAIDATGSALAVWEQSDGTRFNIWANRYTSSTGWGTAQLIETDNADNALFPKITFDPSGNALAIWNQGDGTRQNIWASRYTSGTGWGTAQLIESDNAGDAGSTQIAVNANGVGMAIWIQNDGTRYNVWANRFTAATGWATPVLIETDNLRDALNPRIAIDATGNAIAVWQQSDGIRTNIWTNRFTVGTDWGAAQLLETDNVGNAFNPEIAMDTSGNALAVWSQFDGTRFNIWAPRYQ